MNICSNKFNDQSAYIRDFDNFRMKFERAFIWSNVGSNYCMMNYIDNYLEKADEYESFDTFIHNEIKNLSYDDINRLHNRLIEAKNIHSRCLNDLNSSLNDLSSIKKHEQFTEILADYDLEENILYNIDNFLETLKPHLNHIAPVCNEDNILYIYCLGP